MEASTKQVLPLGDKGINPFASSNFMKCYRCKRNTNTPWSLRDYVSPGDTRVYEYLLCDSCVVLIEKYLDQEAVIIQKEYITTIR